VLRILILPFKFPQHVVLDPHFALLDDLFATKRFSNNFSTAQNFGGGSTVTLLQSHDPTAYIQYNEHKNGTLKHCGNNSSPKEQKQLAPELFELQNTQIHIRIINIILSDLVRCNQRRRQGLKK